MLRVRVRVHLKVGKHRWSRFDWPLPYCFPLLNERPSKVRFSVKEEQERLQCHSQWHDLYQFGQFSGISSYLLVRGLLSQPEISALSELASDDPEVAAAKFGVADGKGCKKKVK